MKPVLFCDDPQFWYETQRVLGHTAYGGADTGEVLATALRITAGDYDSWNKQWAAIADRLADEAEQSLKKGHLVSARDGLMRASSYYRSAEFFLHADPGDPRVKYSYERSVACFAEAGSLFSPPIEAISIPFDGPGQPAARHRDGLVFRPDWEYPVGKVLDWLLEQPGVEESRVALLGASMGGLLAARAAAFDHRIAACVAVDGIFDLGVIATSYFRGTRAEIEAGLRADHAPELDLAIEHVMEHNSTARWAITQGCFAMGVDTPRAFLASYLDYSLGEGVAERITCPTLICEAEDDIFFAGQPEEVYNHLTCPKALLRFSASEGAGAPCHSGAQRLAFGRILNWLDETFDAES